MMRRRARHIFLLLVLLISGLAAHAQNRNNLITAGKNLILLIDITSPSQDIDTILKHAAINAKARNIINGDYSAIINDGWSLTVRKNNILQFNRPLKDLKKNAPETPFVVTADIIKDNRGSGFMDNALYGVNDFSTVSVYELPNGFTRFTLPGYLQSRRVILAGGFNDWSTLKDKMTKTATGWQFDIKLEAGAWMYKFIIDGHWISDPDNRLCHASSHHLRSGTRAEHKYV